MPLVVVDDGALRSCYLMTTRWPRVRRIGLFSNPIEITRSTTMASLVPCVFSGYAGELPLGAWTYPVMEVDRAASQCEEVVWTYNGGPTTDYVAGYYVVDSDGVLLWAERYPGLPVAMVTAGQQFPVVPRLTVGTRYGGVS